MAFKNSLFVPYQLPLKLGLSANKTTLPEFILDTNKDADPGIKFFRLFFEI